MTIADGPSIRRPARPKLVYRHSLLVRVTHWVNVLCILVLLMSGLQIFNAHPALYIGPKSDFSHPVLSMTGRRDSEGGPVGETQILGATFNTTGVLGLSTMDGIPVVRGFPAWATLPSYQDLATGRRWHLFFAWLFVANGAIYVITNLVNRHVWRDLVPGRAELRRIAGSVRDHLLLRFHQGSGYNVLQKLAYLAIIFIVLPAMIFAGMAMSPGLDAGFEWLAELFGGRQTARTVHFLLATTITLFLIVHVVMVLISGAWNNIRSMITGRYATDEVRDGR